MLLNVVDDGGVLENAAVVGEVDGVGLLGQLGELAAGVVVALLEGDERVGGGALEGQLAGQLGPVELEGCAALRGVLAVCRPIAGVRDGAVGGDCAGEGGGVEGAIGLTPTAMLTCVIEGG